MFISYASIDRNCSIRVSEQRDQNSELAVFNDGSSSNFDTGWTSPSGFPTSSFSLMEEESR